MLAIADEAGIRDVEKLKVATAALADPRRTDRASPEQIIATSRLVYYFNAALHSDETGSTEAMLELADRIISTPSIASGKEWPHLRVAEYMKSTHYHCTNSTRRFFTRPISASFDATGE